MPTPPLLAAYPEAPTFAGPRRTDGRRHRARSIGEALVEAAERWGRPEEDAMPSAGQCDQEVFTKGIPLLAATTGPVGGALLFEEWVQAVAAKSGQRVDWHYSGWIAQVLVLGDHAKAQAFAEAEPLPRDCRIVRWYEIGDAGLYRANVTAPPEGAIGAFLNPLTGEQDFIIVENGGAP